MRSTKLDTDPPPDVSKALVAELIGEAGGAPLELALVVPIVEAIDRLQRDADDDDGSPAGGVVRPATMRDERVEEQRVAGMHDRYACFVRGVVGVLQVSALSVLRDGHERVVGAAYELDRSSGGIKIRKWDHDRIEILGRKLQPRPIKEILVQRVSDRVRLFEDVLALEECDGLREPALEMRAQMQVQDVAQRRDQIEHGIESIEPVHAVLIAAKFGTKADRVVLGVRAIDPTQLGVDLSQRRARQDAGEHFKAIWSELGDHLPGTFHD